MKTLDGEIGSASWLKSFIGLYGRDEECLALSDARQRVMDGCGGPELFCLSGPPGSGKTFLLKENFCPSDSNAIYFGSGKFDLLRRRQPYSAIQLALTQVCNRILAEDEREFISFLVNEHMEGNSSILIDVVPILNIVIASNVDREDPEPSSTHDVQKRFNHVMRIFVQTICRIKPLVLSLDDLQYADQSSLDLIQALLDSDIKNFLILGSIRSTEASTIGLPEWLESLKSRKIPVTTFELGNLSHQAVRGLVKEKLHSNGDVEGLANCIFQTTAGNPYFAVRLLEHWIAERLLLYDIETELWQWDVDEILLTEIPSTLEDLIVKHFEIQRQDVITLLKVGAMLGAYFDYYTLSLVLRSEICGSLQGGLDESSSHFYVSSDELTVKKTLQEAIEKGFLAENGKLGYKFTHDKVQQVAYSFMEQPNQSHLEIGRLLIKNGKCSTESKSTRGKCNKITIGTISGDDIADFVERQLYVAVDQMNRGKHLFMKESESAILIELNMRASDLAAASASFPSAKYYLDVAWEILKSVEVNPWDGQYGKHCLRLVTTRAKVEYSLGNVEDAEACCDEILKQANVATLDKIPLYKVKVDILAGQTKKEEALELCLGVLGKLGCGFPKVAGVRNLQARTCLQQTKSKYIPTAKQIETMSFAIDELKIEEMELMEKAGSFAYSLNMFNLYILTRCRWIQWMNKYGLTALSGSAVASFANILMHVHGDFVLGPQLADLALAIQQRINSKYTSTRTLNTANMHVLGWVRPLRETLKFHLQAYENGMLSGNIEGGFVGILYSHWVRLYSGLPLAELEADCRKIIPKMRKMGHNMYADLSCTVWQTALNLMGKSDNTYILTGPAMDEDEYLKKPFKNSMGVRKSFLYAFFGQYKLGAEDALERGDSYGKAFVGAGYGLEPFYRGISLYAMARKTNRSKYKSAAKKVRSQLRTWVEKGCVNLEALLSLLDAEHAALEGKRQKASALYERAVRISIRDGFCQNAALASERYAEYLADNQDFHSASVRMGQAIDYYRQWGAMKKVKLLLDRAAEYNSCDCCYCFQSSSDSVNLHQLYTDKLASTAIGRSPPLRQTSIHTTG